MIGYDRAGLRPVGMTTSSISRARGAFFGASAIALCGRE